MKKSFIPLLCMTFFNILICSGKDVSAFNINYTITSATPTQAGAIQEAVSIWEPLLGDDITIDIGFNFSSLAPNVLGETSSTLYYAGFGGIKTALSQDSASSYDSLATSYINSLPVTGNNILLWYSNNTLNGPDFLYGSSNIFTTGANLKALGYTGITGSDGTINFNSNYSFDYDRSNGISSNEIDFIGVAVHEIGHVLGMISGVDINAAANSVIMPPSLFDLFRHSDTYGPGQIDISFDGRDAYLSFDTGVGEIDLSDGANSPDGRQAGHWADNQGLGIMDPTASFGELLNFSGYDLMAFDIIGYEIIPEPDIITLLLTGLFLIFLILKQRTGKKTRMPS